MTAPAFIPSGLPAVSQAAVVNVMDRRYGAKGNGSADDTQAILDAAEDLPVQVAKSGLQRSVFHLPNGEFGCSDTVVLPLPNHCVLRWEGTVLSDVSGKAAVQIGPSADNAFWYKTIGAIDVRRTALDPSGTSVGVDVVNVAFCRMAVMGVYGFTTGMRCLGTMGNGGVSNNHFYLGWLSDNTTNLLLTASGAGYTNQNMFYGGEFNHSSDFPGGVNSTNLVIDYFAGNPLNGNDFYSPSFEDTGTNRKAAFIDGQRNTLFKPRLENATLGTAYLIEFGPNSVGNNIVGRGVGVYDADILDNGGAAAANSYDTQDGVRLRSDQATAANAIPVHMAQSVADGNAIAYQTRDASGNPGWQVTGVGFASTTQESYADKGFYFAGATFGGLDRGIIPYPGNPNGNVTAYPGAQVLNTLGGAGATLWIKESGSGTNTGWVAK